MSESKSAKTQDCIICGKNFPEYRMAKHRNELMSDKYSFCIDCVYESVEKNDGKPFETLRMLNIPYVEEVWENAVRLNKKSPYTAYSQQISLRKEYINYNSSDFHARSFDANLKITDDIRARWGEGRSDAEYAALEEEYNNLRKIREPATITEKKQFETVVIMGEELKRMVLDREKASDINAMRNAHTGLLKELKLDAESVVPTDNATLGERIKRYELKAPVPEVSEEFKDVDKVDDYFRRNVLTPLKDMFNRATDEELQEANNMDSSIVPTSEGESDE